MKEYILYDPVTKNIVEAGFTDTKAFEHRRAEAKLNGLSCMEVSSLEHGSYKEYEVDEAAQQIVRKSDQKLKIEQYERIKNQMPPVSQGMSDAEIDQQIADFYYDQVDPVAWRKENYAYLRSRMYPPMGQFIDAYVKSNSQDPDLISKGQEEMQKYVSNCLAVKTRFPKPLSLIKEKE